MNLMTQATPYDPIRRVEDPNYILVWGNHENQPIEIELPRLNLHFKVKDHRVYFQEHAGFSIAEKQNIPSLGGVNPYLVLEKTTGEQMAVFPNHLLKSLGMAH